MNETRGQDLNLLNHLSYKGTLNFEILQMLLPEYVPKLGATGEILGDHQDNYGSERPIFHSFWKCGSSVLLEFG
jgi:hypothetical protein